MTLVFLTGNEGKFKEVEQLLGRPLVQQDVDLPEIQSLDPREVMHAKLAAARNMLSGPCIIEDTSLFFTCLNESLPGPFIKWFLKSLGLEGLVALTQHYKESRARAVTLIGYVSESGSEHIFEGVLEGHIVPHRGGNDFGWGPIFEPVGQQKTFGEMSREEKYVVSMRAHAVQQLREFLKEAES